MEKKTQIKLSTRLLLLLTLMGIGLIVASVLSKLLLLNGQGMLSMIIAQDVFAFIAPALVAMAIFYRKPLHVMSLDRAPSWLSMCIIVVFYIVSLPAMNWLVVTNEAMSLPSWMSGIEQWMRLSEDSAAAVTKQLLDIHSISQLLHTLFVVGFMAGLSEEMLFRGAMLRTMQDSRMSAHAVVWVVAIVFSAFHLQFYGFIPRMVLGLWLGYLLVWTRSLWVPIIAHTLNNSTVVISSYLANRGIVPEGYGDNLGLPADGSLPWLPLLSFAASLGIAICTHRYYTARQTD
ncbi:MAG: CPBP family intramembrane metalloprotease [Muribaculaceae bacterium]|nr:CPBP family intramembrane metalloprotease [Muribaculaceae bacterium]